MVPLLYSSAQKRARNGLTTKTDIFGAYCKVYPPTRRAGPGRASGCHEPTLTLTRPTLTRLPRGFCLPLSIPIIYRQLGGEDVDNQGPSDDEIDIESSQESQHAPHGDAQPRIPSPRQPNRHEDQRAPSPRQLTRDEDQHLPSPRQPARCDERADQRASDTQHSNHNALGNRTRSVLQTVDLNQPPPKEVPERPRDLEKELFDSDLDDPEDEEADQEQSGGGVVEEVDEFLQSLEEEGEGEEDIQHQATTASKKHRRSSVVESEDEDRPAEDQPAPTTRNLRSGTAQPAAKPTKSIRKWKRY
ncbi:hypothetical protein BKA70DRAFT_1491640 [Coprinopsis sp. MPI-PUGE-AT-0042]|nr:hypothetical protein BKA70DRAFT_1491640 [Coprinopsis sp. MPI-PUGE-AT-0042]